MENGGGQYGYVRRREERCTYGKNDAGMSKSSHVMSYRLKGRELFGNTATTAAAATATTRGSHRRIVTAATTAATAAITAMGLLLRSPLGYNRDDVLQILL